MRNNTKIAIVGAFGKMGGLAHEVIMSMQQFEIVAMVGRNDNLDHILQETKPDIAFEFTSHLSVYRNAILIMKNGVKPIIGSSGLTSIEIQELSQLSQAKKIGGLIIPNFSIGIALITHFAKTAARFFDQISLAEYHHAGKKDAPSGTSRYLADILELDSSKIASTRSDGFLAKHQIYFNSSNERMIIDHESFGRNCFAKGIELSLQKIMRLNQMVIGLENII